jgi:hypothetical protein
MRCGSYSVEFEREMHSIERTFSRFMRDGMGTLLIDGRGIILIL